MHVSRPRLGLCLAAAGVAISLVLTGCSGGGGSSAKSGSGSSSGNGSSGSSKHPNVVFLLTDDLDAAEVSRMPNLQHLIGDEGATFERYYASVSLCCPSRSTTLRGQYSHNTGVKTNGGTNGGFETAHRLGIEDSTIGTWMQSAGYRTAYIGKYLNGYPNTVADTYVPPGWDEFASAALGHPYSEYRYTLNDNGTLVQYGTKPSDYGTDVYMGKANSFITSSSAEKKPFFLYLNTYAPHQPATPAPQDVGKFAGAQAPRTPNFNVVQSTKPAWVRSLPPMTPQVIKRVDSLYLRRIESLQAVDRGIKGLVDTLQSTGQLDNTYFVFTSDNGFHLGQFRMPSGKQTAYETDIHLPLMVRGPGVKAASKVDDLVGNVDLAPTFADMGGASTPSFVDGRSFLPLIDGSKSPWDRNAYLVEHWKEVDPSANPGGLQEPADPDQADASASTTTPLNPNSKRARKQRRAAAGTRVSGASLTRIPEYHGLRTSRYLYVEYETGERELYDVTADPYELSNLASETSEASTVAQLHAVLAQLENCKGSACRKAESAPVPG
jgi:N-acetylglucosamine-6-sulfatase